MSNSEGLIGASGTNAAINMSRDEVLAYMRQTLDPDMFGTPNDEAKEQFIGQSTDIAQDESMSQRAQSILALKLSKSTRRFLMTHGIRTREALLNLDVDKINSDITSDIRKEIVSVIERCKSAEIPTSHDDCLISGNADSYSPSSVGEDSVSTPYDSFNGMIHMSLAGYLTELGLIDEDDKETDYLSAERVIKVARSLLMPDKAKIALHVSTPKIAKEIVIARRCGQNPGLHRESGGTSCTPKSSEPRP